MNLASVDMNLLVALDLILEERNLTVAGRRLGSSQPAMSHTLWRLRKLFDDELLIRIGRSYELTPLARELRVPLRDALKQFELVLEQRPTFDPAMDERSFQLAASDYASYLIFQPVMQRLQTEAPHVRLQISPLTQTQRVRAEEGEIDLIVWPESVGPELPHEVLFSDRWVAIAWSGNDEVDKTLTLEQYVRLPHIGYGAGAHPLSMLDQAVTNEYPETQMALLVESFFMLPFMLSHTRYIAVLNEKLARKLARKGDVKVLRFEFTTEPLTEAMYWHPRFTTDPAHQWLRGVIVECVSSL
jgi:LysR family transcriptional regulator, nod-box dependent transcriptional activator